MKRALLARSPLGLFAFSEAGELLFYKIWDKKRALDKFLSKDIDADFSANLSGFEMKEDPRAYQILRQHIREYAKNLADFSDESFNEFLSQFSVALSTRRLQGAIGRDKLVVQSIRTLDDLIRSINVFSERLYEWYSLHYPEMKNINIVDLIAKHGRRDNMPLFKSSTGVDLTEDDESSLRQFAYTIQNLTKEKTELEKYIGSAMKETAKNFSSLIDPLIAARLLAYAGSLEKLSRMTASTIQLLGAEKALFRHMHQKGKSPKYGIIYNCDLIQRAPNDQKGKVARLISSKLMLAARIDYYSGRDESEKMKRELDEEIKRMKS